MSSYHLDYLNLLAHFFLRCGQYAKAATLWETLVWLEPNHPPTEIALAYARLKAGDPERALALANGYLTYDEQQRPAAIGHYVQAQALWRLGQRQSGRAALQRFMQTRSQHHG